MIVVSIIIRLIYIYSTRNTNFFVRVITKDGKLKFSEFAYFLLRFFLGLMKADFFWKAHYINIQMYISWTIFKRFILKLLNH